MEEAVASYDRALMVKIDYADALNDRGRNLDLYFDASVLVRNQSMDLLPCRPFARLAGDDNVSK